VYSIVRQPEQTTKTTQILRRLVVAEWALIGAGASVAVYLEASLPGPLRSAIEAQDQRFGTLDFAAWALFLVAYLVGSIGVFRLWPPARNVYTLTTLAGFALMPLFGHQIAHAWSVPLSEAETLVLGLVIALLWFSPAAAHFGGELGRSAA